MNLSIPTAIRAALIVIASACFLSHPALAQPGVAAKPLPIRVALSASAFGDLAPAVLSGDDRYLAYTVRNRSRARIVDLATWLRTGVRDLFTGTDIRIVDLKTRREEDITSGQYDNFMPTWCGEDRDLVFLSDRDGSGYAKLWTWSFRERAIRKLADQIVTATEIACSPSGREVIVTIPPARSAVQNAAPQPSSSSSNLTDQTKEDSNVTLYQTLIPKQPALPPSASPDVGPWNLDWAVRRIAIVDIHSGRIRVLTGNERVLRFRVSPDGRGIAYSAMSRFESSATQQILFDLKIVDLDSGSSRTVAKDAKLGLNGYFAWSPDSSRLSYREFWLNSGGIDCFVVDAAGGPVRKVTNFSKSSPVRTPMSETVLWGSRGENIFFINDGALWKSDVQSAQATEISTIAGREIEAMIPSANNVLWSPDDGTSTVVLVHDAQNEQDGFYRVDLDAGKSQALLEGGACFTCTDADYPFIVSRDLQRILYYAQDAGRGPDLWMNDFRFSDPQRVTSLNPQFDQYKMGSAQLVHWLSDDGEKLRGVLLLPPTYQEGVRYPLIVWPYAGSRLSRELHMFGLAGDGPLNMQLLATRGFVVLLPDSPQGLGSPMLDLVKTILPGINRVIEMGFVDPNRIGVFGHSNGGYSVLALITQTNRFKAAVEVDGMGDLTAAYGQMEEDGAAFFVSLLENGMDGLGGPPWQVPMKYLENSPLFYLDRITTPILLVQGSHDRIVEPFLAGELYVALRRLGKEAQYARYERESHSPLDWNYEDQLDFCSRVIAWFEQRLSPTH